jgi:hypothetical protein
MPLRPTHFYDEPVDPIFNQPPALEKSPPCPDGFTWQGTDYHVVELLEEWRNYARRGRMGNNMRPSHSGRAAVRGSWGVGRFHFRVRVEDRRVFELYYDRAPEDAGDRKGRWFLYCEWGE